MFVTLHASFYIDHFFLCVAIITCFLSWGVRVNETFVICQLFLIYHKLPKYFCSFQNKTFYCGMLPGQLSHKLKNCLLDFFTNRQLSVLMEVGFICDFTVYVRVTFYSVTFVTNLNLVFTVNYINQRMYIYVNKIIFRRCMRTYIQTIHI